MKNLILTPGITGSDGISTLARLVLHALGASRNGDPEGHPDVVSLAEASRSPGDGVYTAGFQFQGAGGSKLRFAALALRAIRESADTSIICMHLHLAPVLLPLMWRGARVMILLHGVEAWKPLSRMQRWVAAHAGLIAVSAHTAQRFRQSNPEFSSRPIAVCHPGLPQKVTFYGSSEHARHESFHRGELFALLVGRMAPDERYKGHDLLIEMWPRILAEHPQVSLYVVGDGKDRRRLETKSMALGLGGRVRFTGKVSDHALERLYRDCAFFLMPSRHEGFGIVFLEAMRAEKACIGGVGAAGEIIEDGVTGFVVDPGQPVQVQQAILRLFKDPETRERMGRAGAKRQAEKFSEELFRRRFRSLVGCDRRVALCAE